MVLEEYKKKREFKKTSEPSGEDEESCQNRFVVQEHHARNLHYDFRLELPFDIFETENPKGETVLKSWAVPKQPPTEPKIKRLAVQVEDHPVNYIDFSGEIPEGQYGAGKIEIWDKGKFDLIQSAENELEIKLSGEKLKGKYILVQTKMSGNPKNWLLFKKS